ncbi:unnamed protein product [Clonostachys byssicola]|uniref:Uncharacterized protein n=1 Tax=Clonostachys byssicola TaxID=160290 RepID=A0A9N9UF61_9HYPO|nr:unnamed protein product [Clonostachys byssicola]
MAIVRKKPTLRPCDIDPGRRHRARSDSDGEAPIAKPSPSKIQQIGQGSIRLAQTSARCVQSGTRSMAAAGLANLKWILLIWLMYYLWTQIRQDPGFSGNSAWLRSKYPSCLRNQWGFFPI